MNDTLEIELRRSPQMARSFAYSSEVIATIRSQLEEHRKRIPSGTTIALAGSLGRFEATQSSDVDCIVLVGDEQDISNPAVLNLVQDLVETITRLGLRQPKADGIFARPVSSALLLDPDARGSLEEPAAHFGTRMQLLLDARPVFNHESFFSLRDSVLRWYEPALGNNQWAHLLNDLARYLHSYAVWQQFKFSRSADDGWYLRQAKLRTTRVVTFAALLLLVAEDARHPSARAAYIKNHLDQTPLARMASVFAACDESFAPVMEPYVTLQALLADDDVRHELIQTSPQSITELPESFPEPYKKIHEISESMMNALTRFIVTHYERWPPGIMRNWVL